MKISDPIFMENPYDAEPHASPMKISDPIFMENNSNSEFFRGTQFGSGPTI